MKKVATLLVAIALALGLVACGDGDADQPGLFDLAKRACQEMSVVAGSDDWRAYSEVEERAHEAGFSTSEFDDAIRELCQDTFSEYVNSQ